MKRYFLLIVVFFLLIAGNSNAQNFFPLSVGNKYQIKHYHDNPEFGSTYTNYTTKYIIVDSLVYNNEIFYKYNNNYFLYDTVQQKLFIYSSYYGKQLAADFNLNSGEEFISYIRGSPETAVCEGTQLINVFGQSRLGWRMEIIFGDPPFITKYDYTFVDEIGSYYYSEDGPGYDPNNRVFDSYTYYSAIIDSQIYNYINLSITLLTILQDTQLSDFPFGLNVAVSLPQMELLGSLYLYTMVVRDSVMIWEGTANFNFTTLNVSVNPAPSDLEVGDEVRLKIVATDNTIFENHTELPTNGYFSIKVLPDQMILKLYPLAVGNKWIYDGVFSDQTENYSYSYIREVDSLVMMQNQHSYFRLKEYQQGLEVGTYYERVDSLSGTVYRYAADSLQSGYEYLIDDLTAGTNDTIFSYRFPANAPYAMIAEGDTTILQFLTYYKTYDSNYLVEFQYNLAMRMGLTSIYNYFDFGSDIKILRGAIVNNIVYGDTSLTVLRDNPEKISDFSLFQNYPNPFNPVTTIRYTIGDYGPVLIKVFDVLGNEVSTLVNEEKPAGRYSIVFDAGNLTSGIYFYRLKAGSFSETKKLILLK